MNTNSVLGIYFKAIIEKVKKKKKILLYLRTTIYKHYERQTTKHNITTINAVFIKKTKQKLNINSVFFYI